MRRIRSPYLHYFLLTCYLLGCVLLAPGRTLAQTGPAPRPQPPIWYELIDGQPQVHLYFFWSKSCPHCQAAHPFVDALPARYPWLALHSYELTEVPEHAALYMRTAASIGEQAQYVPAFFVCGAMLAGYDSAETTGAALSNALEQCHTQANAALKPVAAAAAAGPQAPGAGEPASDPAGSAQPAAQMGPAETTAEPALALPLIGAVTAQSISLPVFTLVVAGLDAFNPCAFFVLMFLLSLMVHAQSRRRMALIGAVFVVCSALLYFVFMAAWLNIFLVVGELALITTLAGIIAIAIAAINIKDFFWFKQGVSLSIPDQAKPNLYQRTRSLVKASTLPAMLAGTAVLALAANSYELLCTAGFPMIYTRTLTLEQLPTPAYYAWLAVYNVIYVIPLLVIVAVFTVRFGARKLTEAEGRTLKLLSGLMMLLLGILLVAAPALLADVTTALALLLAALGLTAVLMFADRRWWHPGGKARFS